MQDLQITFCTSKHHVMNMLERAYVAFRLSRFLHRTPWGGQTCVVRELSCQSVETFAPQEMVLESNRPPGVVEPRRDKTGRGLAVSKELRGVCESNIRSHRPSSLSSRSTISGSLSLSALTLEVSLVNEIRYAHCVTQ